MVTITNGVKTFRVTAGSVKPYEGMGFHVISDEELEEINRAEQEHHDDTGEPEKTVKEKVSHKSINDEDIESGVNKEDVFVEELLEKPLSQWSSEEVRDFVRIKGIDTSNAQKVSQVRGIIKTYLEEQNKNA